LDIIVYTTEACGRCNILKDKIKKKNIDFKECQDINEMKKLGINAVPVLKLNDDFLDYKAAVRWINEKEYTD
jgi:glutaredoxin